MDNALMDVTHAIGQWNVELDDVGFAAAQRRLHLLVESKTREDQNQNGLEVKVCTLGKCGPV